eukprot:375471-Prorocentrum_minimum.AAC.2
MREPCIYNTGCKEGCNRKRNVQQGGPTNYTGAQAGAKITVGYSYSLLMRVYLYSFGIQYCEKRLVRLHAANLAGSSANTSASLRNTASPLARLCARLGVLPVATLAPDPSEPPLASASGCLLAPSGLAGFV